MLNVATYLGYDAATRIAGVVPLRSNAVKPRKQGCGKPVVTTDDGCSSDVTLSHSPVGKIAYT